MLGIKHSVSMAGANSHPNPDLSCRHLTGSCIPLPQDMNDSFPSHLSSTGCIMIFHWNIQGSGCGNQPCGTHPQQGRGELSQGQWVWNVPLLWHICPALRPWWSISGTSFNFHCNLASYMTMIIVRTIWQQKLLKHSEAKSVTPRSHC